MSPRISASGSASVRGGVDVPHARTVTRRIPPILRADACQHDVRLSGYPNRYTMMKSALGRAPCARWRGCPARPDDRGGRGHPEYGCRPTRGSRGPSGRCAGGSCPCPAAGVCPRDQLSMPAEEGIGRDQGVPVAAYPSPEARGLGGPAPARGVGDPETARTALLSEDAMLFLERVNDVTRLLVDPARDGHDEELQHVGNRRHTGRASQRLSAVTNVATRRASSVESARRTASIGFLDSTRSTPTARSPRESPRRPPRSCGTRSHTARAAATGH